jgi:hypothetical protein
VPQPLPAKPGLARPFWYSHLLFRPTLARPLFAGLDKLSKSPPIGLPLGDPRLSLRPIDDPKLPLLPNSELLSILSFKGEAENGLPLPEPLRVLPNGELMLMLASSGLPRPESGEPRACTRKESARLPAEPSDERGVALRE